MPATLRHIGINADDLERGKAFYEKVFGWTITPTEWDSYLQISIAGMAAGGLAKRRELVKGLRTNAPEITFAVEDIQATLDAAERKGATVLMRPPTDLKGVRLVGYFLDTEENIVGVGQYPEPAAAPPPLRYFAIACNDVQRAKGFYEHVFGWTFEPWGPPNFYLIKGAGAEGGLHDRKELINGVRTNALEPTFAVDDIRATMAAALANGAKALRQISFLESVGHLAYFQDTEGNIIGLGQYL